MNDATLQSFRDLADAMRGDTPTDWEWVGPHMSQRMFGITRDRAEEFAARHGGIARRSQVVIRGEMKARRWTTGQVTS